MTGAGLAVLRASQSGDATNAPAPNVDQVLLILPGNNVITDAQRLANGMFTLRFYGETGANYVVKASTNLVKLAASSHESNQRTRLFGVHRYFVNELRPTILSGREQ